MMSSALVQCRAAPLAVAAAGHSRRVSRPIASSRSSLKVAAFRGDPKQGSNRGSSSSSGTKDKQRNVLGTRAPRNERENAESVVSFVAVAALFLTGVLFVFPALLVGSPATTVPLQRGINKAFNIKEPANTDDKSYAPGPGPAAAPGSPATKM